MTTETVLPVVVRRRKGRVAVARRLDVEIVIPVYNERLALEAPCAGCTASSPPRSRSAGGS